MSRESWDSHLVQREALAGESSLGQLRGSCQIRRHQPVVQLLIESAGSHPLLGGEHHVVGRDTVSPPQLSRYAPIADVLQPPARQSALITALGAPIAATQTPCRERVRTQLW